MKHQLKFNAWNRHLNNPNGFTLIEMVMAITLLGVIGIFSTQFITSITQSAQLTTAQKGLVDDAKLAMEYLIREVRVSSEEQNDIVYSSSPSAANITFDKFNGYTEDISAVGIVYSWDSGTKNLTRTSGTEDVDGNPLTPVTTILATQVTSFTVTAVVSGDIKHYIFTITLTGSDGENFTLKSGVRPRSTTV